MLSISTYRYDSKGNKVEEAKFDASGNPADDLLGASRNAYRYDSEGNLIEESTYDSNHSLIRNILRRYDMKNRLIEEKHSDYVYKFGELKEIPKSKKVREYEEY